ncbi:MAG: ABC transporter ATP-binding protein [Anaerolineae bacterium]|nr:ABC transporter ATP-binding protein [Anaerolineae bacterium]
MQPELIEPTNGHVQIELKQVIKNYRTPSGEFPALRGIDLSIDKGQMVAVLGKSGAGKTTLINMLGGIDRPTSGDVIIGGTRTNDLNENRLAIWRGIHIGIVFQFFQLLPSLTVLENVKAPMDFCDVFTPRERVERAMHLLEMVEIAEHAHKRPTAVSGGQQQRIAIARALANDPQVIIGDEPTGNLDSRTADTIWSIFETLVGQGKTLLLVTHDEDLAKRASRRIELVDGLIVSDTVTQPSG